MGIQASQSRVKMDAGLEQFLASGGSLLSQLAQGTQRGGGIGGIGIGIGVNPQWTRCHTSTGTRGGISTGVSIFTGVCKHRAVCCITIKYNIV